MDNNMNEKQSQQSTEQELYMSAVDGKQKKRVWSVVSIVLAVASLVCCCSPTVGITAALVAIVTSIVSRKSLGYFDKLSLTGLILAIFGLVFGIFTLVLAGVIENNPEFKEWYKRMLEELERQSGENM